jgi:flagellar hook-associated protein 1 FlgK
MVFFTTLNTALTAIQSQIIAVNTIGHNIANATTPGYSRQRVIFETRPPHNIVVAQLGAGVQLKQIQRVIDASLESRLRQAASTLSNFKLRAETMGQVESVLNALSDVDILALLGKLFDALEDLANNPQSISARQVVVQTALTLANSINDLGDTINGVRAQLDDELQLNVDQINRITEEIAELNKEILLAENGGIDIGAANDLRDKRELLLKQLAEFVDITVVETPTGEVNVLLGSAFLVSGSQSFDLATQQEPDNGILISNLVFADGGSPAVVKNGSIKAIMDLRDDILRGVIKDLSVLANSIAYEFNKVHSTGDGLKRYSVLKSEFSITYTDFPVAISGRATQQAVTKDMIIDDSLIGFPLDLVGKEILILSGDEILERRTIILFDSTTGTIQVDRPFKKTLEVGTEFQIGSLPFKVQNGSFEIVLTNESTGTQQSFSIDVDLDKILPDTSLEDIVSQINAVAPGVIVADIVDFGRLRIRSLDENITFSFRNDSSGFLAGIGLGQFFSGNDAFNIGVNETLFSDPTFFAAGKTNNPGDNSNVLSMLDLRMQDLVKGEYSFEGFYQNLVARIGSETNQAKLSYEAQQLLNQQLENQRQRVSGVNIDEEVANMLVHQRAFQAAARLIATVDALLETLIMSV